MHRWRGKLVLTLIIYFAGFATAIYMLAPTPDADPRDDNRDYAAAVFKSDRFAMSVNSGLHKCVDFVKDVGAQAHDRIKVEIDKRRADS